MNSQEITSLVKEYGLETTLLEVVREDEIDDPTLAVLWVDGRYAINQLHRYLEIDNDEVDFDEY